MGFSRQEHWSGLPFLSPKGTIERKKVKSLSPVCLFATPWTVADQAPPSMAFSRQEYWSGLPFPFPTKMIKRIENRSYENEVLCNNAPWNTEEIKPPITEDNDQFSLNLLRRRKRGNRDRRFKFPIRMTPNKEGC